MLALFAFLFGYREVFCDAASLNVFLLVMELALIALLRVIVT